MPTLEEAQADVEFTNNNNAESSSYSGSSTGSSSGSSEVAVTDHRFSDFDECFDDVVANEHSPPDKIVHFMRGRKLAARIALLSSSFFSVQPITSQSQQVRQGMVHNTTR